MARAPRLAAFALLLTSCAGVPLPRSDIGDPGQLLFNGYANPRANCFKCHGGDAGGAMRGPSLEDTALMEDAFVEEQIASGVGFMPAYRDALSEQERRLIVEWLRVRFPKQ